MPPAGPMAAIAASAAVYRGHGLHDRLAGGGLREMGGKTRFMAPLDVLALPVAA